MLIKNYFALGIVVKILFELPFFRQFKKIETESPPERPKNIGKNLHEKALVF